MAAPVPRRLGQRIMAIGTLAGLVKPTTGYAFQRIYADSRAIVDHLKMKGNPFYMKREKARFAFYDHLLLYLLEQEGEQCHRIFESLFQHNSMRQVLKFLSESTSVWEDAKIFAYLPKGPFLKALGAYLWQQGTIAYPTIPAAE